MQDMDYYTRQEAEAEQHLLKERCDLALAIESGEQVSLWRQRLKTAKAVRELRRCLTEFEQDYELDGILMPPATREQVV